LMQKFSPGKRKQAWTVINYLLSENKIKADKNGKIVAA